MESSIIIEPRNKLNKVELCDIHKLRAKVFKDRMGWEVPILSGMEIDGYDALDPYYMVIRNKTDDVCGCWRLLPTEGPYMLKDTFPELLHGERAPVSERVWELSRFAIETESDCNFGFAQRAMEAMRKIVTFADEKGIDKYVTVTTVAIERLLRHAGIDITRFGKPLNIGKERAIALEIHLEEKTRSALFQ
ncbi:acyl-homoserine-lactone synthase [Mixta theicola]|uniref:Acyl-homoserine-lactone synthase n=1 Tax=Mixta theicola TaxID=1458355 RepID=A0A2K1Q7S7_9GAMM|nr:acyl-homoserine-lactone synthase [Mixta theicola]PNS11081.1 acyl-homoserine-lactone synthase [Mixta theicola]GLR08428.1 acyl-homoserine-lactone synthase [Mixta theicola]